MAMFVGFSNFAALIRKVRKARYLVFGGEHYRKSTLGLTDIKEVCMVFWISVLDLGLQSATREQIENIGYTLETPGDCTQCSHTRRATNMVADVQKAAEAASNLAWPELQV